MYPRLFNAADLGGSLKEVATNLMPIGDKRVISRWFHSAKDCDLFLWTDREHKILKQQLSFYGQIVEWNIVEGLKTGLVIEDEGETRGGVASSEFVRFDPSPQPQPIEQALALLRHVTALNEREREALSAKFASREVGTNMPAEEMKARFGDFMELERPRPPVPRPLWQRWLAKITSWLRRD